MDDNSAERMFYHVQSREAYTWRLRTAVTLLLATAFLASFAFFAPALRSILQHKDKLLEAQIQGMQTIPDIQAKIANLNEQMKVLSTDSIQNRLQTIENAMRVGNIKPEQVATLEDMRKDLDTLKSYMFSDPKALVDLKQLEKDYGDLSSSAKAFPTKSEFDTAIATTKDLIYFTWTAVGIVFAILMWFGPKIWSGSSTTPIPTEPVAKEPAGENGGEK